MLDCSGPEVFFKTCVTMKFVDDDDDAVGDPWSNPNVGSSFFLNKINEVHQHHCTNSAFYPLWDDTSSSAIAERPCCRLS